MHAHLMLIALILAAFSPAVVATDNTLDEIVSTAMATARAHYPTSDEQEVLITPGHLDSRLQLKQCSDALRGFFSQNKPVAGRATIGVECTGQEGWTVYVPMKIDIFRQVIVAKRNIQRKETLTPADIEFRRENLADLPWGFYSATEDINGLMANRRIAEGNVITPHMVEARKLVKSGDRVRLEFNRNGIMQISMQGTALGSGGMGDKIRVRNNSSGKIVDAYVSGPGVVSVK